MAFNTSGDNDQMMSEINVTPLVDVMLVLLVVFIVTAPLLNNAVHVNLPKTVATAPPEMKKSAAVTVNKDGKIYLDKEELALEALGAALTKIKAGNADLTLHLQADDGVNYGRVAKVMAVIEHAGITKLSVMTAPQ